MLYIQTNSANMEKHTNAPQIMVVPFHGQGHVFPSVELCKRVAARGVAVTIVADPSVSASLQKTAREAREHSGLNLSVLELPHMVDEEEETPPEGQHPPREGEATAPEGQRPEQLMDREAERMEEILRGLPTPPVCVIGDVMVPWVASACKRSGIPVASFFTSGACALAFEHAIWKHRDQIEKEQKPFAVPGFPTSMTVAPSDTDHGPPGAPPGGPPGGPPPGGRHRGPRGRGPRGRGPNGHRPPPPPRGHGANPPWMNEMKSSVAALVNTSRVLEAPFVDYVATEIDKPSWAVGPLLPTSFWESTGRGTASATHDSTVRGARRGSMDEDHCLAWLDRREPRSVVYVSFGSEVGPTEEEIAELALGLEAAGRPFILVLQEGYEDVLPGGFEQRVEGRGLVIRGWAPQLLILGHAATGGFVSHCGWNSTVESLGHGVPLLAWPIRGDQHYNAKLLVNELRVAAMVGGLDGEHRTVTRQSVVEGVKALMESEEGDRMREKAEEIRESLRSSRDSSQQEVDAFLDHFLNLPRDEAQGI